MGHQLRGHPHHLLTRGQQVTLKAGRQMTTILDSPNQLRPELTTSPAQRLAMTDSRRRHHLLAELLTDPVDGDEGMCALVDIGSNNNHGGCLLHCEVTVGPVGGHISVGAMPRSYQVTPAGPSHPMPTKRMNANPKATATL